MVLVRFSTVEACLSSLAAFWFLNSCNNCSMRETTLASLTQSSSLVEAANSVKTFKTGWTKLEDLLERCLWRRATTLPNLALDWMKPVGLALKVDKSSRACSQAAIASAQSLAEAAYLSFSSFKAALALSKFSQFQATVCCSLFKLLVVSAYSVFKLDYSVVYPFKSFLACSI